MSNMARPKASLKSQQRQHTRRRLLDAALSLYASEGYEATSVDDICKRAALSKGAFYFHFSGKEASLAEALKELGDCKTAGSGFPWGETGGQARMSLTRDGGHSWDDNVSAALQLQLWSQALRQENVRHHLRQRRTRIVSELRHAHASGGTGDAEAFARGLVALQDGLVLQSLLFPDDPIREDLEAAVAALARNAAAGEALGSSRGARIERRSA